MTPSTIHRRRSGPETESAKKRKRNSCSPGVEGVPCTRCKEQGVDCTYDRPAKRRGPPPRRAGGSNNGRENREYSETTPRTHRRNSTAATVDNEQATGASSQRFGPSQDVATDQEIDDSSFLAPTVHEDQDDNDTIENNASLSRTATFDDVIQPDILEKLVEIFYHTAYPVRPYFHWPSYRAQIRSRQYQSDWGLYTFTMSICTMAAGRLCDGVLMPNGPHPLRQQAASLFKKCYRATIDAIPSDITSVPDHYQAMKAKAILAAACLQSGDWKTATVHLGDYASLSAMTGFCQESSWPSRLTEIQKQERRRVFWGVYQQEQYLSSNFNFASRQREVKAMVKYPVEVFDDDDITETGVQVWSEHVSFVKGFNFCTDLYRILERMEGTVRARQQATSFEPGGKIEAFFSEIYPSKKLAADSLHLVSQLYDDLPQELKKPKVLTGDLRADRYGFIASNVLLTTQTLRMLLVGTGTPNIHLRCAIASELLDQLSTIPIAFFHASSTVSLHHLAHIGHMLGGDVHDTLPIWTYLQVRNILIVLADFLEKIESDRMITTGLAEKLRAQIDRIDHSMKQASQSEHETGLLSMGKSLLPDWQNLSGPASSLAPAEQPQHYRSPPAHSATSYGTGTPMQSLFRDATQPAHQRTSALDATHSRPPPPNRDSSLPMQALSMAGNPRDLYSADISHNSTAFEMPTQLDFSTGQPPMEETLFSGDLFSAWPYLPT
ncbi:hypothetical protein G7054_g13167 [Neopestalotiopsis clavispora]|nr:hypothetical protein G7054_g13167 [Neopestalotiopsis clavispora]